MDICALHEITGARRSGTSNTADLISTMKYITALTLTLLLAMQGLAAESNKVALTEFHKGMVLGFLAKNGYFASPQAYQNVDRMAELNIKWVNLIVVIMQESWASTRVFNDYERTQSDYDVAELIDYIHKKGMKVLLYVNLEMWDGNWRGRVNFPEPGEQIQGIRSDYWGPWFQSYTAAVVNYGRLAQKKGVEMMCVGAEMDGSIHKGAEWGKLVDAVRSVYSGAIAYEMNGKIDFGKMPKWFNKLDVIGYSFYRPSADKPGATVDEMVAYFQKDVDEMQRFAEAVGKPLIFTEFGCLARTDATLQPGNWKGLEGKYDGEEQAKWMEAMFRAFWDKPWVNGFYWWKWDEHQYRPQYHSDPAGDQGFTIYGKPAAKTMKEWYSKRR